MNWKDFFRPNLEKVVLFLVLVALAVSGLVHGFLCFDLDRPYRDIPPCEAAAIFSETVIGKILGLTFIILSLPQLFWVFPLDLFKGYFPLETVLVLYFVLTAVSNIFYLYLLSCLMTWAFTKARGWKRKGQT